MNKKYIYLTDKSKLFYLIIKVKLLWFRLCNIISSNFCLHDLIIKIFNNNTPIVVLFYYLIDQNELYLPYTNYFLAIFSIF